MIAARPGPLAAALSVIAAGIAHEAWGDAREMGDAVRVEGIAALVGGSAPGPGVEVIYRSDVELRARVRKAGRTEDAVPTGPLPERVLRRALDELVGEALIAREAERLGVDSPEAGLVARERRRLERKAGGAARLRRLLELLGASPHEIDNAARRRAVVRTFLETNLQGVTEVTEAKVERVYQSGKHPFRGENLQAVRDELRAWLAKRAVEHAVQRWVRVLRARTAVRIVADYGAPAESEEAEGDAGPAGSQPRERPVAPSMPSHTR